MPSRRLSCDIVIPCYNEERRLDIDEFLTFAQKNRDVGFTFVNDGSIDATGTILDAMHCRNPGQIQVVHLEKNAGKAAAVRAGVLATGQRDSDFFGYFDADGATPLAMIHRLRESLLVRADSLAAFSSRVISSDSDVKRSFSRWLCSRACSVLIRSTLWHGIRDTQCGAKLFRATPATYGWFAKPFVTNWLFDVEVIARALLSNGMSRTDLRRQIQEVAVTRWHDVAGSKIKFRDVSRVVTDLWKIRQLLREGEPVLPVAIGPGTSPIAPSKRAA